MVSEPAESAEETVSIDDQKNRLEKGLWMGCGV